MSADLTGTNVAEADAARAETAAPTATSIDDLLAECDRSNTDGQHRIGAQQAETILARPDATDFQQAQARQMMSLHRLRLGEHKAAVRHGLLALKFWTESENLPRQSQVHCTLALAFTEIALNDTALRHADAALDAARACASPTAEFWALSRVGMVQEALGHPEFGLEIGRRALTLARTLDNDDEARFAGLNNLGDCCLTVARAQRAQGVSASNALQEALALVVESVAMARAQGHPFWELIARINFVSIMIELGRYPEAREQIDLIRTLARSQGVRYIEINNDAQLANVVRAEGHIDEAIAMMDTQLANFRDDDDPALLVALHRSLYEMHKECRRFEPALVHHRELHAGTLRMAAETASRQAQMLIDTMEIEQARHETERSRLEARVERIRTQELDYEAHTDALTRLPNRRALDRELPALLGDERVQPLCAVMIDLDNFKRVNDEHGHAVGDLVLTSMSTLLRAVTRDSDMAVRLGGEEFLLIFTNTGLAQAEKICERLIASVRAYPWTRLAPGLSCTVSAGVSQLKPFERVPEWLERSDVALYEAKHAGRDRVGVAAP